MHLARVGDAGGRGQTAADLAAISAARVLASDPFADQASLRAAAERTAAANGARVTAVTPLADGGLPTGVEVTVDAVATGDVPGAGRRSDAVSSTSRAGVTFSAVLPGAGFRPVDLHGLTGRAAIVAAAAAQIGWPYVWGGESRAEGGFDCSGLVGYAYRAAGIPLPGRPTAATLWSMARPAPPGALAPGDLVFKGTGSGAPYHVGIYAGGGAVIVAPHSGARVRFEPLAAGGWDGFGSLAAVGAAPAAAVPDAALDAAREFDVPAHVVASEVRLGLMPDVRAAARTLAAAMTAHPASLEAAVAAQLGGASAAALVLRDGSGPALGDGFAAEVRLLPRTTAVATGDGALFRSPVPGAPPAQVRGGASLGSRLGDAGGAIAEGTERALAQVAERGSHVAPQAFAAVRNAGRVGLTAASLIPGDAGDLAGMAGSAWDAAEAGVDAVQLWGTDGMALSGFGLLAARISLLGNAFAGSHVRLAGVHRPPQARPHRLRAAVRGVGADGGRHGGRRGGGHRDPAGRAGADRRGGGHRRRRVPVPPPGLGDDGGRGRWPRTRPRLAGRDRARSGGRVRRRLGGGHGQVGDLVDPYAVVSGATTSVSAPESTS